MWLALAFLSAFLLGCYEVNKKMSLNGNAVIPVLFFNTLISSLIFVPFILLSFYTDCLDGTMVYVPRASLEDHLKVLIKAVIVLSSWISGYFALKHLPLTITGPIKASQPVLTLLGAMLLFGERLNLFQWVGVLLSIASFYLLSSSGKKEGIHFAHNKWIFFTVLSILTGAMSGLYDKHLMRSMDAVSYTHLDVYKRQVSSLQLSRFIRVTFDTAKIKYFDIYEAEPFTSYIKAKNVPTVFIRNIRERHFFINTIQRKAIFPKLFNIHNIRMYDRL